MEQPASSSHDWKSQIQGDPARIGYHMFNNGKDAIYYILNIIYYIQYKVFIYGI